MQILNRNQTVTRCWGGWQAMRDRKGVENEVDGERGGEAWLSNTVGTKDPWCSGAEGGRGSETEAERFQSWGNIGTKDLPTPPSASAPQGKPEILSSVWERGERGRKKKDSKEHERKTLSLSALGSSLFPSLPPSRTSLNFILNPLQFPLKESTLPFPVSILFHSLAFILTVFSASFCDETGTACVCETLT